MVLQKLINRDWKTGEPVSVYDLDDYEKRWGYVYNMFHRQYMHKMLMECALQEEGAGTPAKLLVNHPVRFTLIMVAVCRNTLRITYSVLALILNPVLSPSPMA